MSEADTREPFWPAELQRFLPDAAAALKEGTEYMCCAVCYVLADMPFDFFRLLPKRWSEDPGLKEAVCRAGGFCNHHTWRLNKILSQVSIATIYADVLATASEADEAPDPCPLCRLQGLAEIALLDELVARLTDPSWQEQYPRLFGLCQPHFAKAMARELEPDSRDTLRRAQRERNAALVELLHAHVAKSGVGERWTRSDAETRAPRWALLRAAGNEDL